MRKKPKKIHARENAKTKKFMQKEGPIATFSHVVKKLRAEGFTPEKKIPAQAVSEKKKLVQAENSPPHPPSLF